MRGRTDETLGALVHAKSELVLEPGRTKQAQRVGHEDPVGDGPHDAPVEVVETGEGIARVSARRRDGNGVEGEVARRKVLVDAVDERCEVDRLLRPVRDHTPGAVPLGQRERRAAEPAREPPSRVPRVAAGDVEVDDRLAEDGVPHGAADDPCLLAGEQLADALVVHGHPTTTRRARRSRVSSPVASS